MTVSGAIFYLLVLPSAGAGKFSPFQGFSVNAFSACDALRYICRLPATIWELFESREDVIRQRASGAGGYTVALLESEFLGQFALPTDLVCIVSDAQSRNAVDQHCLTHSTRKWLHVTTAPEPRDTPPLWKLSREMLTKWVLELPELNLSFEEREQFAAIARSAGAWKKTTVNTPARLHNITSPSELALASVGIDLDVVQPLSGAEDHAFAEALALTAQELRRVRDEAVAESYGIPGTPVLIVSVPSVFRHLSSKRDLRATSKAFRTAIRQILCQRQYIAMRESGATTVAVLKDQAAQGALLMRAQELNCYTSGLALAGAKPLLSSPAVPASDRPSSRIADAPGWNY